MLPAIPRAAGVVWRQTLPGVVHASVSSVSAFFHGARPVVCSNPA
jgi:hypothetical protein